MPFDCTPYAGFALHFDSQTGGIEWGDGLDFERLPRSVADLRQVLLQPDALPADAELYTTWNLTAAPADVQARLDEHAMAYTLVMLPPLCVGREYVKTAGHFHTPMPGTTLGYPEVYTHLAGEMLLLLQERADHDPAVVTDMAIVEMRPGFSINIPPNYCHVLINVSDKPALMAGLYSKRFKQEYGAIRERRGAAFYVLDGGPGAYTVQRNPLYTNVPDVRFLTRTEGTIFHPPHPAMPLWSGYLQQPDAYDFLTDPQAALRRFR